MIDLSVKDLREDYRRWREGAGQVKYESIHLIAPMLMGNCQGVFEGAVPSGQNVKKYVYRCAHFTREGGFGRCGIYEDRPEMCVGYPDYKNKAVEVTMNAPVEPVEPLVVESAWFKGCGFRPDGSGLVAATMKLRQLLPEEK